jgi:hypothetical protein
MILGAPCGSFGPMWLVRVNPRRFSLFRWPLVTGLLGERILRAVVIQDPEKFGVLGIEKLACLPHAA